MNVLDQTYLSGRQFDELTGLIEGFAEPMRALVDLRSASHRIGSPFAASCIDGALGALRNAIATIHKVGSRLGADGDLEDFALLPGTIALRRIPGSAMVERVRLARPGKSACDLLDRTADADSLEIERLLPHDLLSDERIGELSRRPVFAALLAAAVGRHRWVHLDTGRMSTMSASTANLLVALVAGGHRFTPLPDRVADAALDVEVCEEMLRLGWRRVQSPASKSGE